LVYWQYGERYSAPGYLKNLIVGYPFHFVPLLLFFYFISPVLAYIVKRYGLAFIVLCALGQVALILIETPRVLGVTLPAWAAQLHVPVLGTTLAMWGIYFPLGLTLALNGKRYQPALTRLRWTLLALTLIFFGLDVLHTLALVRAPAAVYISPLPFVLLAPQIKREWIPQAHSLEYAGKRSYGLYFTHMIVIDLLLLGIQHWAPGLFETSHVLLTALLFVPAVGIPLLVMHAFSASPSRVAYRYVFG
jgi:peptidoglycan/LPS O-acetylase OafA/YrhL